MKHTILASVILAAAVPAASHANPLSGCAGPPIHMTYEDAARDQGEGIPAYNAGTCKCLSRKLGWQLDNWAGQSSCVFKVPPSSFDPVHASIKDLSIWGIPEEDATQLIDPQLRQAYLQHVKHYAGGETCNRSGCLPGLSSGLDGLAGDQQFCRLATPRLAMYCLHLGPSPVLRSP